MMNSSSRCSEMMKLFDSHCHLQDPRIHHLAPQIIRTAMESGVSHFAVNGVSEKDWSLVKKMSEDYPSSVIPCFGLHRWYILERTPNWFNTLSDLFGSTPSATVGEIGLDKGSHGKQIDFNDQVQVFRQQLELSKELKKPASVHCVRAFGDLLEIMQYGSSYLTTLRGAKDQNLTLVLLYHEFSENSSSMLSTMLPQINLIATIRSMGPFPAGVILHSYLGSAEMVPTLAKLGAYFSFSGYVMDLKPQKANKMLKSVPTERILLESDAPDALPKSSLNFLQGESQEANILGSSNSSDQSLPKETLNQPANIRIVLRYVASMLEMPEEELAELSHRNALQLFSSYPGSKYPCRHECDECVDEHDSCKCIAAIEYGVTHFAVNGVSEYDWILVKKMSEDYPSSVIPCFGLHPWSIGPFPAGVILHSYAGSAELVPTLTKLGAYFSFSGHNMNSEPQKTKEILKSIPIERFLLKSDAPDALPRSMNDTYNQPANIPIVLRYVASMLEMPEQQLAALPNRNALHLFSSYPGSKLN
ncbi:hypothetical protein C5167_049532 [Papaver somniferum]|uniref:TatD related DNase n=1 Tax=Papaver somniferum TaxID=3469 RepID=A0A4Y7KNT9_PAPSO|nr:hypothetical protein C5167_049532 [Papaver somniferum]